jgi:serine/threonine protein kinase
MMLLGDTGGGRSTLLQAFRDSFAKSNKDSSSSSSKKRNSSKRKSANKSHLKESSGSQPDAFSVNMSYLNMTYDVKDDPKAPNASSKGYSAKPVPQTQTNISWICYDFADQSLEAAHNLFMSEDMVYLIVFNAAHFSKERLSTLELWIRTIQDRCHHPFIYLIGTHLDQVEQSKVPLLQSLRTHWPELGPKPWFDAFFVDASTTSSSAKLPSFANQLTNCVQMKTLICELARRCLQERRCIKDWLPSLAAISSLISSVAYSDQLLPTTPSTRHSIDEKSSPPDRNATKPIQNFMTFSAITSLIYHYGIPDTNIMRIIAALEENGTLLYFGRRELNVQSISLSSSAPHSSVSGSLIASPTSLLSNLAVINPEFCCQLLSQLGLLRNIVSRSGLISLAESRDLFTKMGIKTNDRISGASSSKHSPSLGTSTPSNSSTSLILQIEQFWALLEVVQIAIKVVAPSTTFGAQQRANMIRASDDAAPPNMHPTLAPVYRVNPTYRSSAELALQLNAMDEDAKAALEAKARRQESANLKNRDHVTAPSPDASPRTLYSSSSQVGFKTASSTNSGLPSLENPGQPDTFYFVPSLLPTRPTTTWNRFFKFLPTDSLKLHSARHGVSIEAAENSEHLSWYRRWYRFERIPIGIFGKLIASSMQIPGSEITNPWSRGFEVHLDKEHAQIYFLTPQDLFLDVIGYPSGALLFSLAHTIADVVAGWYHMRDAKDAVSEWVAYRVPTDGTFLYEDVDVIMDAIKNGQSSCIISRRSELGVLQSPKGVQTAFDDLPSSQISIVSSKNVKAQASESPKALGNAFGEGLLTALATPAAAPATGGVEVQLMNIVPDKINKRWEENHIDPSELYMISKVPVGKGGFASVYLAHYKGFKVAVKRIDAAVFTNFEQTVAVEEEDNSTEEVVEIEAIPDPKTKDRTVSLKKLSPEDRRRRQLLAVLELNHEVRIMYALGKHPNLCSMHGFLFSPPQLVLERLECGDLLSCVYSEASKATPSNPWYREGLSFSSESTLKSSSSSHGIPTDIPLPKNALSWTSSLRALLDVARALAHMHSAGIVHRDLALNNVMLHSMDAPLDLSIPMAKVIDFGLAAQLVGGQTGQFHNEKWAILAPEVLSGRPFTASSEVYSFAIMMYQLYTRCLLTFTGEHAIKQGKRPKIPDLPPFPIKISSSAEQMESIKQDLARLKKSLENEIMMAEQDSTSQPGASQKSRSSGTAESNRRTSTMPNATITPFSRYESLVRFVELMGECWAHDPQRRPDFPQVARKMALIWFLFTGISPVV